MARTHYEVLGVARSATAAEVRAAYVRLARVLHPDRGATTGREMQELNEAFRVLRDPGRRAAYDRSLDERAGPPPARVRVSPDVDDVDDVPFLHPAAEPGDLTVRFVRSLPWIVVLVVLAFIVVFTAYAGDGDGDDGRGIEWVGHCVDTRGGEGTVEVPCSEPNEGRVDLVVQRQSQCPQETTAIPDEADWLCVRQVAGSSP